MKMQTDLKSLPGAMNEPQIGPAVSAPPIGAPSLAIATQIEKLEAAFERRRAQAKFVTDAMRLEIKTRCASLLSEPRGPHAAEHLDWLHSNGRFLAVAGNWPEFCETFLPGANGTAGILVDQSRSPNQAEPVSTQLHPTLAASKDPQLAPEAGVSEREGNGVERHTENNASPTPKRPQKRSKKATVTKPADAGTPSTCSTSLSSSPPAQESKLLEVSTIRSDGGTQCRAGIDESIVAEYAERLQAGDHFPPVDVFSDGKEFYLADGHHRILAARRARLESFPCNIRSGSQRDALWFALAANKANGLQRTAADKANAVRIALAKFPEKTQQQVAEQVGCTQQYVSKVQGQLTTNCKLKLPAVRLGKDGKARPPQVSRTKSRSPTDPKAALEPASKRKVVPPPPSTYSSTDSQSARSSPHPDIGTLLDALDRVHQCVDVLRKLHPDVAGKAARILRNIAHELESVSGDSAAVASTQSRTA